MPDEPRRTILCVDDEPDVVDTLFDTFMDIYDVKTATSGEEALKIFDEEDISLVISDQRMPEMEGTELLAKIDEKKPICKKILLTGYADVNAAVDAINLGRVDRYISKPWDDDELIKAVADLLAMFKTDEFFARVIEDAKEMKQSAEATKRLPEKFEKFMDSHLAGICLVGDNGNIEYMNKKGLEIVKYTALREIRGKNIEVIFLINENIANRFREKYLQKDPSPEMLDLKLADGSPARVLASMTFVKNGEGEDRIYGILFNLQR